jgi:dienelactone hydrolase
MSYRSPLAHLATVLPVLVLACARSAPTPSVKPGSAPAGVTASVSGSVEWMEVITDSGVLRAAVARPLGPGPFPALIILHGTHGFAAEYVQLAREVAKNGVLGVAACWFQGRRGAGTQFVTPIECPAAPPLVESSGPDRFRVARLTIDTLIQTIRTLPNVRADRVALFGHSRGAGAALDYVLTHPGEVQAAILNSAGYPPELPTRVSVINIPILILHGTADGPADGGSAFTNVEMARRFEAALRDARKIVETKYYEGTGHNSLFSVASQHQDAVQRMAVFLSRTLFN